MRDIKIMTMMPDDILVKEAFKRTMPSALLTQAGIGTRFGGVDATYISESIDPLRFELLTQGDFLREFDVNSHAINSLKYYPNPLSKDEEGKFYQKIKSRVAIGWQQRIYTKRLNALTGNNVNLRVTSHDSNDESVKKLAIFREGWEDKNIENAIFEAIGADGKTGDCAICFYLSNGEIGWRSFSFEKGDILYPHYDPATGRLALLGRKYSMTDEVGEVCEYLDVWDSTYYARYKYENKNDSGRNPGWVVDEPATPHKFPFIPVAYDRYGGPFWSNSQKLIEQHELAMSQLCENNMAYALRILYAFGAEMDMASTLDGTPTVINSASTDAKVGFLEPADASSSFDLQIKSLEKNIMRSSFAVETPEISSGADMSSLTVKMLFADAYQKALEDSQHFQPFLDEVVKIFKWGYALEIGRSSDFQIFRVKAEIYPYIFMSETEEVANVMQLTSINALSKKSASEKAYELGYGVVSEYERIKQEMHDEMLDMEPVNTAE